MSYRAPHINRRQLLKAMGLGIAATSTLSACSEGEHSQTQSPPQRPTVIGPNGRPVLPWSNWSGNQRSQPSIRSVPKSEDELISLIKESTQSIRCVGAGHSFSPLVPTDQTLISLARLRGLKKIDHNARQATFGAGTLLGQTGEPLWEDGLALVNMPDIDTQSLAGAIATSTHGTGSKFGSLSSEVSALRLVTSSGDIVSCSDSENPEIFNAARTNIGSLGVVTEVGLGVRDAFMLHEKLMIKPNLARVFLN